MYDLSSIQQQQQSGGGVAGNLGSSSMVASGTAGAGTRYRKRSKSRSTQGDFRMKLNIDQKLEIVSKEMDELRDEMRKIDDERERNVDSYEAVLDEADLRIAEMKIEIHEFKRDVLKAGYNSVNKKIVAEKLIKYFDNRIKQRVHFLSHFTAITIYSQIYTQFIFQNSLIDKLKFKNEIMRKNRQKMKADLKEVKYSIY